MHVSYTCFFEIKLTNTDLEGTTWSFRNTLQNSSHTGLKGSFRDQSLRFAHVCVGRTLMYRLFVAIWQRSPIEKPLEELSAMSRLVIFTYQIFEASWKLLHWKCSGHAWSYECARFPTTLKSSQIAHFNIEQYFCVTCQLTSSQAPP